MKLILDASARPQATTEMTFDGGRLTIGRSDDCDWVLDDPEMFISRRHCILSQEGGQVMVTDASSGGLFIDNAANPLGTGNSVPVVAGMTLRMGDFTLRVQDPDAAPNVPGGTIAPAMSAEPVRASGGFDFGTPSAAPAPPPERPASLPDPFGLRSGDAALSWEKEPPKPPRPLDQADPFELDLQTSAEASRARTLERPDHDLFPPETAAPAATEHRPPTPDLFAGLAVSFEPAPQVHPPDDVDAAPILTPVFDALPDPVLPDPVLPDPMPPQPEASPEHPGAIDALYRGLGVSGSGSPEELEQMGRSMRALTEGLMTLLRQRAQERARVRVAQTVIASQNVNPLKFLASTEEGLESLMASRGRGYLDPESALDEAFADLHDHQLRLWAAMQTALRRMALKFDPTEIAREMEDVGRLESLLAGGRSAMLWQLYEERFRDIARAAEEQFMGEIGADFRDAYENKQDRKE